MITITTYEHILLLYSEPYIYLQGYVPLLLPSFFLIPQQTHKNISQLYCSVSEKLLVKVDNPPKHLTVLSKDIEAYDVT